MGVRAITTRHCAALEVKNSRIRLFTASNGGMALVSFEVVGVKVSKKCLRDNAIQFLNMHHVNYEIPLSLGCKQMRLTPSRLK